MYILSHCVPSVEYIQANNGKWFNSEKQVEEMINEFSSVSEDDKERCPEFGIPQIQKSDIEYWVPLVRPGGLFGGIKLIISKIIRRLSSHYLNPVICQQNQYNRDVIRVLNTIASNQADSRARIEHLETAYVDLKDNFTKSSEIWQNQNEVILSSIQALSNHSHEIETDIQEMKNGLQQNTIKLQKVEKEYLSVSLQIEGLIKSKTGSSVSLPDYAISDEAGFDYFSFENKFRGSREEIKNKQAVYISYFKDRCNVLDFGCGRGEFLELMKDNGITGIGIDLDMENIKICKQLGLNAEQQDAVEFLEKCEDDSLGGIIALQIVEHLSTEMIMYVLNLAHRKMQNGAPFIMETLNPQCLMIYAESMYLDPSHTKPVHPFTLQFMAESAGFHKNELLFMTPSDPSMRIAQIPDNEAFNASINTVNGILFGNREYALITYK